MRPVLTDTSPDGLRAAIKADVVATRIANMDVPLAGREEADAAWALPGAPTDVRAVVAWAAFEPETVERRLDEILGAVDARRATVLWWYEPGHRPHDLRERVLRRGFAHVEDTAAMAIDLARLPASVPPPEDARIEPVDDPSATDAYVSVVIRSMEIDHWPVPPDAVRVRTDYIRSRLGNDPLSRRFVAFLDGEPVATSRLSMAGGAAGLYTMVTLPHARRRGIGLAMAHRALVAGREAGMRIGVLQATDMGFPIYRKLGFEELFKYEMLARPEQ
jgi:ribosomal protein S18 acetylase RimI-like enzyme